MDCSLSYYFLDISCLTLSAVVAIIIIIILNVEIIIIIIIINVLIVVFSFAVNTPRQSPVPVARRPARIGKPASPSDGSSSSTGSSVIKDKNRKVTSSQSWRHRFRHCDITIRYNHCHYIILLSLSSSLWRHHYRDVVITIFMAIIVTSYIIINNNHIYSFQNKSKKNKLKRSLNQSSENSSTTTKRKKAQESDDEAQEEGSDTSSATGGRDSVVPDYDARSECSNTTNNDDNLSTRSNSPLVLPIMESLPAKFKRVGPGDENRSCARTDVIFVHPEKPKVKEMPKPAETSSASNSVVKSQVRNYIAKKN